MRSDDRLVLTCLAIIMGGGLLVTCLVSVGGAGLVGWMGITVQNTIEVLETEIAGTQEAYQSELVTAQSLLEDVEEWEVVVDDNFDDNSMGWWEGPIDCERGEGQLDIIQGQYHWDLKAEDGFAYNSDPRVGQYGPVYIEVEAHQLSGPPNGQRGLIFQSANDEFYYYFAITDNCRYNVALRRSGDWEVIIPSTCSDAIRSGRSNKLAVLVLESEIYFFINDTFVNYVEHPAFGEGRPGITAGLRAEGDMAQFGFDNFEVRVPPGAGE